MVTTTPERVAHMVEACQAHALPGEHFNFTDRATLQASPDLFAPIWTDGDGAKRSIFG